jgi:hypothetical protein
MKKLLLITLLFLAGLRGTESPLYAQTANTAINGEPVLRAFQ